MTADEQRFRGSAHGWKGDPPGCSIVRDGTRHMDWPSSMVGFRVVSDFDSSTSTRLEKSKEVKSA